jgi:hypothetical protein
VKTQEVILKNKDIPANNYFVSNPWFAFSILFIIIVGLTLDQNRKNKNGFWLDTLLFSIAGLAGLVLLFLWFGTEHAVTSKNYNLLWLSPFHLIAILMLLKKKNLQKVSSYFLVNFFVITYLLVFWKFIPQEFNLNSIPLLLILAVRSMHIYYRIDKTIVRWKI